MLPGHIAPPPPPWLVAWRRAALDLMTLLPRFPELAGQCRRLALERLATILRRGLTPEMTPETCAHPSNLMTRYGNRRGRYARCAMCGSRSCWDEATGGWRSSSASSRSTLPLPTSSNILPVGTASKARARAKAATSYPTLTSLPESRTRRAPSEFDLASEMSHERDLRLGEDVKLKKGHQKRLVSEVRRAHRALSLEHAALQTEPVRRSQTNVVQRRRPSADDPVRQRL